ncbi:MAG: S-adenosylmethionine decarboxylase family protein [Pyrinomonadaceae bacterium]
MTNARVSFIFSETNLSDTLQKPMAVGVEWLIEAEGCEPRYLSDERVLKQIFAGVIADLDLHVLHSFWHCFPFPAGITGFAALSESHLACHTYPEHGIATFNLYCCRERPQWNWKEKLTHSLGAQSVRIIKIERGSESTVCSAAYGGNE